MSKQVEVLVSKFYRQVAYVTLGTAIIWTLVVLFNILSTDYPSAVDPDVLAPLSPAVETEIVERLKQRTSMQEAIDNFVPAPVEDDITGGGL